MPSNTFHRVVYSSTELLTEAILKDENTMCIHYSFEYNCSTRVYPKTSFKSQVYRTIVLVNAEPEYLTYLKLLGIKVVLVTRNSSITVYETVLTKGMFDYKDVDETLYLSI